MSKTKTPQLTLSRRKFVTSAAAGGAVLGATSFVPVDLFAPSAEASVQIPLKPQPTTDALKGSALDSTTLSYHDRYRNHWTWSGFTKGTHSNNCGLQASCSFNVYTRDGNVVREEQAAVYPQTNPDVPDFNPKGCQKGCGYSEFMQNENRLTSPLKRVGERGAGKWQKVSWDEALTDIANGMVDAIEKDSAKAMAIDMGTGIYANTTFMSVVRFWQTFDCLFIDTAGTLGDLQQGFCQTIGETACGRSYDDFFYSDLIFIWNGNPAYTQIPHYHFISEARYNGTKIIAICPDLNASALHADEWVTVIPGTDAALALGMAQVVVSEHKYDEALLREQTDFPCLVRVDNKKYLTEKDFKKNGSNEPVYFYDLNSQKIKMVDVNTLALGDNLPALDGTYIADTLEGPVEVRPAFEELKEHLDSFPPALASTLCGVSAERIRRLAHELADAKAATNMPTTAFGKNHHGDSIMRSQILLFALCGHVGRHGAGFDSLSAYMQDGVVPFIKDLQITKEHWWDLLKEHGPQFVKDLIKGKSLSRASFHALKEALYDLKLGSSAVLFYNEHAGDLIDEMGKPWDPAYKRDVRDYVKDAADNGEQFIHTTSDTPPKVYFNIGSNPLRRSKIGHHLKDVFWPKLDLIVTLDLRLSSTAMHSDYVLPVTGSYERNDSMMIQYFNSPFVHAMTKATTIDGCKDDWEILNLLTKKVQQIAIERKIKEFTTVHGKTRRLDEVYDHMSFKGRMGENDADKAAKTIIESATSLNDVTFEKFKKDGFVKATGFGLNPMSSDGQASDIRPGETIYPHSWHTEDKEPWVTRSGRMQFYIDHDWFLEAQEQLPTHKVPPKAGGDYPIRLTGGHNRWSIHAQQRTDPLLLRLQRGEPCLWINEETAKTKNIKDGDRIRVFNDIGSFITQAKTSATPRPDQVIMYHAWEDYQFEGKSSHRSVFVSKIKPIQLVRDYPLFKPSLGMFSFQPNMGDRDTRVDYEKVS